MLVRAWDLRLDSLTKHQENRGDFGPERKAKSSADETISILREKFDCLVGVHAQRDYKQYMEGSTSIVGIHTETGS